MKYSTILPVDKDKSLVKKNLESFYQFIYKRQKVWYNRFVLKLPQDQWTKNKILSKSKYTNVYRELDRGTLWWFQHVYKRDKSIEETIWRTCVYRLLNKVETFDIIGVPYLKNFKKEKFRRDWFNNIQKLLDDGVKVWTSATITLQSNLKATRLENYKTILGRLLENIDTMCERIIATNSIEEVFKILKEQYGVGPFTAYEIVTDLAYIDKLNLDIEEWANIGPGAIPGIKLIFPWTKNQEEYLFCLKLLRDYQEKAFHKFNIPFYKIAWKGKLLSLRNCEHVICEFRKFYSENLGVGRPRPRYIDIVLDSNAYEKDLM